METASNRRDKSMIQIDNSAHRTLQRSQYGTFVHANQSSGREEFRPELVSPLLSRCLIDHGGSPAESLWVRCRAIAIAKRVSRMDAILNVLGLDVQQLIAISGQTRSPKNCSTTFLQSGAEPKAVKNRRAE